jgi:succinyl-CoA synthetase alpha subunit
LLLEGTAAKGAETKQKEPPHTLFSGLAILPDANLVLVSTPGLYAAAEARKALQQGRHVMIFSDNVPLEDEKSLKAMAAARGLLLMGPDCGTAIIGGIPLGFANMVRRGAVGVVGASGTGIQEVTSLIDRYGGGVSHAIGTGSRDLSEEIGGAMTIEGLRALAADPSTQVIVVVSKPPHPDVARHVAAEAQKLTKPVVLCFVGWDLDDLQLGRSKVTAATTLQGAARRAVSLSGVGLRVPPEDQVDVRTMTKQMASSQRYVRGLFSGGTFCYEAMLILRASLGKIFSNTPLSPDAGLPDAHHSLENTCLDLGADEFTVGRPHPMIDLSSRAERIVQEAADPEVAVLLLDVVLGYGAHPDPASVLAGAIEAARKKAAGEGRSLAVVASICGTHADPQGFDSQRNALLEAGSLVAGSNAAAARLTAQIAGLRSAK